MDTTTNSDDIVIQTLEVSETIPETNEDKVTGNKTEENPSWPIPEKEEEKVTVDKTEENHSWPILEKDEEKVTATKTKENHSWRHGLSQLPPRYPPHYRPNAGHHFHREWKPKCNHYTMTRLYTHEQCQNCGRRNGFGWLYRCTVDREALIIQKRDMGLPYAFDPMGYRFGKIMTLGKRGPEARSDKLSFLKELTKEELATYTPEQLVTISQQRDNVAAKIEEARIMGKAKTPYRDKPWMPSRESECRFTVCHSCHHFGDEKSVMSLNAILNDEIAPTVATAYGFSLLGFHQMANVSIVKNIGYRPIRLPRHHPARPDSLQSPHRLRLNKGPAYEHWLTYREHFPPRGSLRRSTDVPDLRFSPPDPSVRMAINSITTPQPFGSLRKRWAPELLLEGPGPYGQNFRAAREKSDEEDAAAVAREDREAVMNRTPLPKIARMFMEGRDTPPRQIGDNITAGGNGGSSSSAPVVDDDDESVYSLPDIDEATEDSSGTWETESVAEEDTVALTEEAVELGTPDMVAL